MRVDVVVDIGNSRIKWGWLPPNSHRLETESLPTDDPSAWDLQAVELNLMLHTSWVVASVNPAAAERFQRWADGLGYRLRFLTHADIPLRAEVDQIEQVGIDRLLSALAARQRAEPGTAVVVITVGTAVTVDLVKEDGTFAGGAILPGPRLMARSLHAFTARLPDVGIEKVPSHDPPGRNTQDAITVGIMAAIMGGCAMLVDEYAALCTRPPIVLLAGGAVGYLTDFDFAAGIGVGGPFPLTLEGIRLAAEGLP
jgi:type III pantothenate kinase